MVFSRVLQRMSDEREAKIETFELLGGVRARWWPGPDGGRFLIFEAAGTEVRCDQPSDWEVLEDGEFVSTLTWFWNVDDGNLPFGPYATEAEARAAAERSADAYYARRGRGSPS